jgi:hypothetical protein
MLIIYGSRNRTVNRDTVRGNRAIAGLDNLDYEIAAING